MHSLATSHVADESKATAGSGRRVLVTGANGFLGSAIVLALLRKAYSVVAGFRTSTPLVQKGVTPIRVDVRDSEEVDAACRGVDAVIHVAGLTGLWGAWKDYYQANVVGTQNVIGACRRAGVRRLVFTSSPSVTFDGGDQQGVDESAPYPQRWLCHYPRSKAAAEQAVLAANGNDLATCALRPHLIWGPGDMQLVPQLVKRARSGRLRQIGDGKNLIDVTYIDNAAHAHVAALESLSPRSAAAGKAYFISQDEPVPCWDWIREALAIYGLAIPRGAVSKRVATRAARTFEAVYKLLRIRRQPPLTRFLVAQLSTAHYFDISAARRDLGYEPIVSLEEGMRRLAASVQSQATNAGSAQAASST